MPREGLDSQEDRERNRASAQGEILEVDVLVVGGGTAGLSTALKLARLWNSKQRASSEGLPDLTLAVLEKGSEIGDHSLSGAVLNPLALRDLLEEFEVQEMPVEAEVTSESLYFLSRHHALRLPWIPPFLRNASHKIVSASLLNRYLGQKCEEAGILLLSGMAGVEVLYEESGDRSAVIGVRTGDRGRDRQGRPKPHFEPGVLIHAKALVFAEGPRGSLFRSHLQRVHPKAFQGNYEEGVKEIIELPPGHAGAGQVIHFGGFPLFDPLGRGRAGMGTRGGAFLYTLKNNRVALGLVAYLNSSNPYLDPHRELQRLKTHPWMRKFLKGGVVVSYGAKVIPCGGGLQEGGIPLWGPGWLAVGDAAHLVDSLRLKGLHLAMKSGVLAAEALAQLLSEALSPSHPSPHLLRNLKLYENKVRCSWIPSHLESPLKTYLGGIGGSSWMKTGRKTKTDAQFTSSGAYFPSPLSQSPDGRLFLDKLSGVYLTGTSHDEDSPSHLLIKDPEVCRRDCFPRYGAPCTHFCPAQVYESSLDTQGQKFRELHVHNTNCIHCKTCDIKCPFENIQWVPPEGGGGPRYRDT